MIATIAISSGSTPATSVPKTISRMISDAGSPKKSSPCCRSSCESFAKSSSAVSVPVIVTANAPRLSACTWSTTSGMTPSAFVCSVISAASAVAGDGGRRLDDRDVPGSLELVRDAGGVGLDACRVRLRRAGADDDHLRDVVRVGRQPLRHQGVGAVRLGVVRQVRVARQHVPEGRGDDAEREHDRDDPGADGAPRVVRRCAGESLGHGAARVRGRAPSVYPGLLRAAAELLVEPDRRDPKRALRRVVRRQRCRRPRASSAGRA